MLLYMDLLFVQLQCIVLQVVEAPDDIGPDSDGVFVNYYRKSTHARRWNTEDINQRWNIEDKCFFVLIEDITKLIVEPTTVAVGSRTYYNFELF